MAENNDSYSDSSLDSFCGSSFWNNTLYTDDPAFSPCFEITALVWVPCFFLWVTTLLEIYHIYRSREQNIPWNKINISKLSIILVLIFIQIVNLFVVSRKDNVFNAHYYDPAIKMVTFILAGTLICLDRKYGLRTSGVLFIFWLLLTVTGLPQLRTEIRTQKNTGEIAYSLVSYVIYYSLVIVMCVLSTLPDLAPQDTPFTYDEKLSAEHRSGFLTRLTFTWFDPLVWTGFKRSLRVEDLYPLNPEYKSKVNVESFERYWQRAVEKREIKSSKRYVNGPEKLILEKKPISILPIIIYAFGGQFMFAMLLKMTSDIIMFLQPELLKRMIGFVENDDPMWMGYFYASSMFVVGIVKTLLLGQNIVIVRMVIIKIKNALNSVVFKKALYMSNASRKESTIGEIINIMSTDISRFGNMTFFNILWSAPLQVSIAVYLLWYVLGPSVMAGVAVIIILIPLNGFIARLQKGLQSKLMKYKDNRLKLMSEILNGIKILKMYAWEPSFQELIVSIRTKELKVLKKLAYLNAVSSFIFFCTPFLVSLMSFTCFVLVNDKEVLDAKRAFVALSLFNILRWPLTLLPNVISDAIQLAVSIKRLNKFLNCDELDQHAVENCPKEEEQIVVENGYFTWGDKESPPILKNINLRVKSGLLVAVVGSVGAGKSSLVSALLGEMDKISGRINVKGNVAYVPQQAWILNATVQDNITFSKPFNQKKYFNIIDACELATDIEILPGGDQTEIGEKGINLSGGQKQRVSLARAVYYDADNYYLDDPLSAVDSHVGKHIFDKVIGPNGLLKDKTRIWVTHNMSYLAQTDLVIVLRDGQVSEAGTYQQLVDKRGAFAEFLLHHQTVAERTVTEEGEPGDKVDTVKKIDAVTSITKPTLKTKEFEQLIELEKTETGKVKWSVYKHYLRNLGIGASIGTLFAYIVLHTLQISTNFWLARWSSDKNILVNGTIDEARRDMYLGVYGGLGIAQALVSIFSNLLPFLACWRAAKMMHAIMLDNVLHTPLQFFEVTPVGRILSRFSKDVDTVDGQLNWLITSAMQCGFEVVGTLVVISYSTPLFITVIVPLSVVYYFIQRIYVPTSRQLMRIESTARSPIYSHFNESVLGATTIRAFNLIDKFVRESQQRVDNYHSAHYLSAIADRWLGFRLEIVGNLVLFFAALFAVIGRGSITAGIAGLSLSYTLEITRTLRWLVIHSSGIETNIVAVERIKEYTEVKQEATWNLTPAPASSWPETGAVRLEELTLSYKPDGEPALRNITCQIEPRDKIGIVGRTGAGKSTLTLGLFRIVEALAGRILVDGLDIAAVGLHQLRSRITIIPQDPVLFSGSLRMNLDPFNTYSDDDIWRAIEHAHLKPYVEGLPNGLLHEVSEGGENLSVGQRQLVCLARALLRKTPLLVLDEATAAIDLETDELIQKSIRSEFASCTVLTIAHRLNTIMDSTKVMVLDKGKLVEFAPPGELLKDKRTIFYSLAKDAGLVE